MNAEKELLLALLIEKYTTKTQPLASNVKIARTYKKRRMRGKRHEWTQQEKDHLVTKRNEGHSFRLIAGVMGLRVEQVENMYYTLVARDKAAK